MKNSNKVNNRIVALVLALSLVFGIGMVASPAVAASSSTSLNSTVGKPVIASFKADFDSSLAQTIVGRAIWYMKYGYMVYDHSKYPTTGYIDCSNFVSLVYKDFGYSVTSAARNYDSVGVRVSGVYVSNGVLKGADKLKPGDILTFQRTYYISHVAMYIGSFNGKPCFIGTTKGYPTAIGIVSGFHNWYGTQFHSVRRVLPTSAYKAGGKITDKGPIIPARYAMKPTKSIVMPKSLTAGF